MIPIRACVSPGERTLPAYERTQIAWVRTALALISFGFAISTFFSYLREQQGERATVLSPRAVGITMIVIALIGLTLATWRQQRAVKLLRSRCPIYWRRLVVMSWQE